MPSYVRSGAAIAVNSLTAGTQMRSTVKAMDDGGFMVFWYSSDPNADGSGYAVRAQRYSADGVRVGVETLINTSTAGDQVWPRLATLKSGAYVIAWETSDTTQDGSGTAIKARMFDASGAPIGGEFRVNTHVVADQKQPNITALADGGFLIAWQTTDPAQDGYLSAIKAQRFDSSGAPVGAEFLINSGAPTTPASGQADVDITGLANGGFVASWQATGSNFLSHVKVQIFAADGSRIGPEFIATSTGGHNSGRVAALQDGGFLLTWSGNGNFAQFYDSVGNKVGAQFVTGNQPEIAQRSDGSVLITSWDTYGSVTAQVYSTTGQTLGPATIVHQASSANGVGSGSSIALLSNGNVVLSYDHYGTGTGDIDIRAQILRPNTGLDLGAASRTASIAENGFWQLDVLAQVAPVDSPGMPITYSIVGGADASKFILTSTGELRFNSASNYEAPTDSNGDNVYEVIVRATDGEYSDEQSFSVSVTNVNESPDISSNGGNFSASLTVSENQSAVTTVTAADPEGSAVTYSISGGADRNRFTINASTGVLSFVSPPNFEARADADGNNVYLVTVSASDGQRSDSQQLSITVSNVAEGPVIAGSQTNYFHDENVAAVATLSASDGDGDALAWSIAGGADAALFAIDPVSGALRFVTAPSFEAPEDAGANNVYNVIVAVSDGTLSATRALTVNVANREEGPVIVSGGGGDSASVSFAENSGIVTTILADDPDAQDNFITYRIAGGADAAAFTIDIVTGQLRFKSGFGNFEAPADAGGDNVYDVIVSADDGWMPADTQALSVTVTDANDAPVITSNGGEFAANVFMAENLQAVTTVKATDADNNPLTYAIAGGADAALFAIDAQTGFLSFIAAPDREAPRDADANNSYFVTVSASDGAKSTTQQLTVRISDVNEAPVIVSNGGGSAAAVAIAENGLAVTNVAATDPEGKALSYSISGGADASRFAINSTTGALSFVAAPDHEQPADSDGNNVYDVVVRASDGVVWDEQAVSVTVGDVNEGVAITSAASASTEENGTAVMTVTAQDLDGDSVSFAISGGADSALFAVDSATGALSFLAAPNFEAPADSGGDNVYEVEVSASDGSLSASKSLTVTVTNQAEAIVIVSGGGGAEAAVTVNENEAEVMSLVAVDPDGSTPSFSIMGGADGDAFYIDPVTQTLRFRSMPGDRLWSDFETPRDSDGDNVYEVIVATQNGHSVDWQTISVTVANVYEGLGFGPAASFSALEGILEIGAVSARHEVGFPVVYSISGGPSPSLFSIDPVTGVISWVDEPDFEGHGSSPGSNVYHFEVTADNGIESGTQYVTVTLGNVDEPVEILSYGGAGTVSLTSDEGGFHAAWVEAADPEGATVAYAIVGGADSGRFTIDSSTGELSFAPGSRPDFEAPADSDGDNVYEVTVEAAAGGTSATQTFEVTVSDLNEGIFIASNGGGNGAGLTLGEGAGLVTTVVALDPDGATPVYSITGGADASRFIIDAASGALSFAQPTNFESPADADGDNVYDVQVSASDGELTDSQSLSVAVVNVDEPMELLSYGGAAAVALDLVENGFAAGIVAARDGDGSPVTYSITGGADGDSFQIDPNTGALSFREPNAPDFEDPTDFDSDNVHEVIVTASSSTSSATQAFTITIVNGNDAPWFASYPDLSANEGDPVVTTVVARDVDGDVPTYAIVGGPDAARFAIDAATGLLTFIDSPDFETPLSAAGTNVYTVEIEAGDGEDSSRETFHVTVGDVNEGVTITSGGGGETAAVTVGENGTAVTAVAASDGDGDTLTYSIAGGADGFRFTIDPGTGALRFAQAPNFEAPADAGGDNVYDVVVSVTDGVFTDSQALAVTVGNAEESVAIASNGGGSAAAVAVAENGTAVAIVAAGDPDGATVSYAIAGGADAARFTIDPGTGALAFVAAPDFEDPKDAGADNVYDVIVSASDGSSTDSQSIAVTVGNVDEPVEILSYGGAAAVALTLVENGLDVAIVQARDEEGWPVTYAITGGADAGYFQIDHYTGALSFIDPNAPDFEDPADVDGDNVYDVVVTAITSTSSADQAFAITVTNQNEGLWIYSNGGGDADLSVDEGGRDVTTVVAIDREGTPPLYSILGGADAALFAIDASTGVLTFIAAPDYEAPNDASGTNVYTVEVGASDGEHLARQTLRIAIGNVNEGVTITSGGGAAAAAVTIGENGLAVTSIAASDVDGDALTYSISGGADAARFAIDAQTGALRFVQAPNFEAPADSGGNNVYDVVVSVTDGAFTDSQAVAVTVANVNEAVAITSNGGGAGAAVAVAENGTAVTVVAGSDPEGGTVTYAIAGGADSARFTINSATGALAFVSAPNFEAPADAGGNNVYDVVVSASDGSFTDTQALAVSVGNVNEAVTITSNGGGSSAVVALAENGTAVATVSASDADGGAVTYAIAGGADSSRFTIDSVTGALVFIAAPNFEAPGDSGGNNVYDVLVSASDGLFTDTQAIAVQIGNVNEAPAIGSNGGGASAAVSVAENALAVTIVSAGDPEGTTATYSIVGGADAARFTINPQTGLLQFVVAPDHELPADSNGDNVYAVVVRASDGQLVDDQALSVTVTNTRDGNIVTGTSGSDSISATSLNQALRTSNEEDNVFGRDGHDNIQGMAGDDDLNGEGGNDVLIGGAGADRLAGGLGKDQFTYNLASDSTAASRDLILDFSRTQGDKISLSAIDANTNLSTNQAFTFIGTAAFSNVAGQLRYETSGGITTISGDVNGDGVADLQIQLQGTMALIASDFIL